MSNENKKKTTEFILTLVIVTQTQKLRKQSTEIMSSNKKLQLCSHQNFNIFYAKHGESGIIWSYKNNTNTSIEIVDEINIVKHVLSFNFGFNCVEGSQGSQAKNEIANGNSSDNHQFTAYFIIFYGAVLLLVLFCYWMQDLIRFYVDFIIYETKWAVCDVTVAEFFSNIRTRVKQFFQYLNSEHTLKL